MKMKLLLLNLTFILSVGLYAQFTTTVNNSTDKALRLLGTLNTGTSGAGELVLTGPLNTAIANDTRCFIAWKNSGLTYAGGIGASAGTLLLQSRTDAGCPQCGIDMVTRDDIGTTGAPRLRMRVTGAGNVGIGVDAPEARLHVGDKMIATGGIDVRYSPTYTIAGQIGVSWMNFYGASVLPDNTNFNGMYFNNNSGLFTTKGYHLSSSYKNNMYFQKLDAGGINPVTQIFIQGATGNVGIGVDPNINNPTAKLDVRGTSFFSDNMVISGSVNTPYVVNGVNAKLSVKGIVVAQKLKVTLTGWADYVFEPTYELPSLEKVEEYIKQNKHLADVPSAEEVEKNGLDVGENNAVLLRKVEELTLYLIEQNKQLKAQNEKLATQNQRIAELEKKVAGK